MATKDNKSRRQFLRNTVLASLSVGLLPGLAQAGSKGSKKGMAICYPTTLDCYGYLTLKNTTMKKIFFLSILTVLSFLSFSQPTIQWQKSLGGTGYDWALSIQQTADGGYIVAGRSNSNDGDVSGNHGNFDYWVVKMDSIGNLQWQKSLGGSGIDYAHDIKQTADGGYIVAGTSTSNDGDVSGNHGQADYWVVKLDSPGNIQWQKSLGGGAADAATSIQQTADGGYIVAGTSTSNNGDVTGNQGSYDYWVVKLDSQGNIQWQKSLGGSGYDEAWSIQQTADGGYIVAGYSLSNDGDVSGNHGIQDYWVVKLDSQGNLQWQKSLGGSGDDRAWSIQQTADGGYIVAGASSSIDGDVTGNNGNYDSWIVKLDGVGNIQWQKSLGGSSNDGASSIQQTNDGGFIVAGYSSSNDSDVTGNHGIFDYWVVKLDNQGNIQWQKSLGGSVYDFAYSIQQTADGGYIVAGESNSNNGDVSGNQGGYDYWVVKLSPFITGIEELNAAGISVYPNPVNDVITITSLKEIGEVKIYDVMGKLVLSDFIKSENSSISIKNFRPGLYIINFGTAKYNFVKQ